MRFKPPTVAAACAALAVILAFPAAEAATAKSSGFTVRASNGYVVVVSAESTRAGRSVWLSAFRPDGFATYELRKPGTLTGTRIKASFGKLGEIDMRISKRRGPFSCSSDKGGQATFRGIFRFRGEHDYTRVRAKRARGFFSPYRCGTQAGSGRTISGLRSTFPDVTVMNACRPQRSVGYIAFDDGDQTLHLVSLSRSARSGSRSSAGCSTRGGLHRSTSVRT